MTRRTRRHALWAVVAAAGCSSPMSHGPDGGGADAARLDSMAPSSDTGGVDSVAPSDASSDTSIDDSATPSDAGGDEAIDTFLATVPVGEWRALPSTHMADVCPTPSSASPCGSVQSAWSGAAWDSTRERLLVYGGGHGDSWYNNIFAFELGPMRWRRLTELPSNATGNSTSEAIRYVPLESCGYYPTAIPTLSPEDMQGGYVRPELCTRSDIDAVLDRQQPRSSHTYGKLFYVAAGDRFCYLGGGYYPSAQASSPWGFCYAFATNRWEQMPNRPAGLMGRGSAAVDAMGHVWYLSDDSGPIAEYTPSGATGTWATFGAVNYDARGTSDVDRRRHHLWLLRDPAMTGTRMFRYDLNDRARLALSRGSPAQVDGTGDAPARVNRPGFVYADEHDRFFAWGGGRDVFAFDPVAETWTRLPSGGDDPGMPFTQGTYGRLRYSARRNVLVLANGTARDVYVYRLPRP